VTASGIEIAPALTDSDGVYVLTVKTSPGLPIRFRVEENGYNVLDEVRAVAPPIPVNFLLVAKNKKVSRCIKSDRLRSDYAPDPLVRSLLIQH